jgi:hypothetical protein
MSTSLPNNDPPIQASSTPDAFGDWRKIISTMPDIENKLAMFTDAIRDIAGQSVAGRCDKAVAVDELLDQALVSGLIGELGQTEIERRIGEGFVEVEQREQKANGKDDKPAISAIPFMWRDPASIPPRQFLYARHYVRQYLTTTIAPSGLGKTSLAIGEALAMVSGKPLLGTTPQQRLRVWLWNGEDPRDELERRIIAAMVQFGLKPQDIDGHLFMNVGRETPIIIATQTRSGTIIAQPVIDAVIATIKQNKIDVVIIDPFVKSHKVSENDNMAIDGVATQWAQIADVTMSSVEVLHHPRKTGGMEVTVEDGRGASSLINASRSARVLNRMSKEEAAKAGLSPEMAWRFFRVDNGKASMAPRPENADWYQLKSIALGNGDNVGVAATWTWPDPFADVTVADLVAAQKQVAQDGPWRENNKATQWVGIPIARALKLNPKMEDDRRKVRALLAKWIETGAFKVVERKDKDRHTVKFVEVGDWADEVRDDAPAQGSEAVGPQIPVRVIGPAPPGTVCIQCHKSEGKVFRIKRDRPGAKAETLHEGCAKEWFEAVS